MAQNKKQFGGKGEELACKYLLDVGFEIIERNYTYGKGEIDIIAKDGEHLVFIEVKSRHSLKYGLPEYSITRGKLNQIRRIASAYLYEKEIEDTECRIDVVTILFLKDQAPTINHIRNALLF